MFWLSWAVAMQAPGLDGVDGEGMQCFHQTYRPGNLTRKRRHGFLQRMTTKGGRKVVKRRTQKGRWRLTA